MAKNTNPLAKGLLIKQSWNTISLPITSSQKGYGNNELIKDMFIRKIINGIFLKLGVLTSDIHISKNALGLINIKFIYYPLSFTKGSESKFGQNILLGDNKQLLEIIKILKLLFKVKYPKNEFKFVCIKAANKFVEPKILNDYIHFSVMDDPNRIKFVLSNLIREYSRTSISSKV